MTIAEKRIEALEAFNRAEQSGDWEGVAKMLADLIPKPKAAPKAGPEWCEYTAAQHKGRGRLFHANMSAMFEFADGAMIRAPMRHRCNMATPDWAGAARFAVRFYRLKLARELLDVTGGNWGNVCQCREETYAAECQVPEFVDALDEGRDVKPDLDQLNAATSTLREGHVFMAGMDGPDLKEAVLVALYGPLGVAANGKGVPRIVANGFYASHDARLAAEARAFPIAAE